MWLINNALGVYKSNQADYQSYLVITANMNENYLIKKESFISKEVPPTRGLGMEIERGISLKFYFYTLEK